jgi:hypothetical protein
MRRSLTIPLLSLAAVAGAGLHQDRAQDELRARVAELEGRLETVELYLQDQARALQVVGDAVDRAVEQGFTWGENWASRETLVEAWRLQAETALIEVPGVPRPVEASYVDPRVRRRAEIEQLRELRRQRDLELQRRREAEQGGDAGDEGDG